MMLIRVIHGPRPAGGFQPSKRLSVLFVDATHPWLESEAPFPVQLAAETSMKMGLSSSVAPIFMSGRGNPKGDRCRVPFLASSLGTQRRRCLLVLFDSGLPRRGFPKVIDDLQGFTSPYRAPKSTVLLISGQAKKDKKQLKHRFVAFA